MSQKITISVCLTSEELHKLDNEAKEQTMSRSALLGQLITHSQHTGHINNTLNLPDGCKAMSKEEVREELHLFYKKIDRSLTEDRQVLAELIKESHPEG